eukprot:4109360-Prymnesium_polylepis.1
MSLEYFHVHLPKVSAVPHTQPTSTAPRTAARPNVAPTASAARPAPPMPIALLLRSPVASPCPSRACPLA